jgi:hypothetical protein
MADWRTMARAALLTDNQIDDKKVAVLRKELLADKRIERPELEFLFEAKKAAKSASPAFERLVFEAVRVSILGHGKVTAEDAAWLRQWMLADGKVGDGEKKLLKELKLLADATSPEFQALYKQFVGQ